MHCVASSIPTNQLSFKVTLDIILLSRGERKDEKQSPLSTISSVTVIVSPLNPNKTQQLLIFRTFTLDIHKEVHIFNYVYDVVCI